MALDEVVDKTQSTFQRRFKVLDQRWNNVENETKSGREQTLGLNVRQRRYYVCFQRFNNIVQRWYNVMKRWTAVFTALHNLLTTLFHLWYKLPWRCFQVVSTLL